MKNKPKKIEPDGYYSAGAAFELGIFHWKSKATFYTFLGTKRGRELLVPMVEKNGKVRRIYLRGANIISYLKLRETGKL